MSGLHLRMRPLRRARATMRRWTARRDRGGIAFLFALTSVPLAMMAGLAVDYSFFISTRAQLNLAADAAAMHAVRVATLNYNSSQNNSATATAAGVQAGKDWFVAQLGSLNTATLASGSPTVNVAYTQAPSSFSSTVTYQATISPFFSKLFNMASWNVTGNSQAVISDSYVEIVMLLDDSASMLLGSTTSDIVALEQATPCSTQSALLYNSPVPNSPQPLSAWAWNFPSGYGYGLNSNGTKMSPPVASNPGSCSSSYDGAAAACFFIPTASMPISAGQCTNGGGATQSVTVNNKVISETNVPQAPCGFACHISTTTTTFTGNPNPGPWPNDYYGLARSLNVTLRLDVVQAAAANVIGTLINDEESPGQFTVGVYQFNTALQQLYPPAGTGEAGTDLATAQTIVSNLKNNPTLSSVNGADTNFAASMTSLSQIVTATTGTGQSATNAQKNLFIVTDGMNDATIGGNRTLGPMTSATNETICQQFKNLGFAVYVLYTPYLPVPNPWYFTNAKPYAEPTSSSSDVAALQACATNASHFYQASDPTSINNAMQAMLQSAIDSAGRISH